MTTTPNLADIDLSKVDLTDLSYFEDGPALRALRANALGGKPALERPHR